MEGNNKILIAVLGGIVPVLIWLWFWLRADREDPEPKGLLLITFLLGALVVNIVLPLEQLAERLIVNQVFVIAAWSAIEEIFKYFAAGTVAMRSRFADEPIDYPIYMMKAALCFSAFVNIFSFFPPPLFFFFCVVFFFKKKKKNFFFFFSLLSLFFVFLFFFFFLKKKKR